MGELTVVIVAFATLLLGVIQYLYQLAKTNNRNTMKKNSEILQVEKEKLELSEKIMKLELQVNELSDDLDEARKVARQYYKMYQDLTNSNPQQSEN